MWIVDGLPLHPLIVHAPVVLLPLVAAGIGLYLLVPGWRRPLGPILAAMAVGAAVTAVAAASSGEALGETLRRGAELDAHRTFGERTRLFAVLLAVGTVALVFYERRPNRADARVVGGAAAVTALALASVTAVAMTGHSGAELAWSDALPASQPVVPSAASAAVPAASPTTGAPAEPGVDVVLGEWALVASTLEAPPGPTTFRLRNAGTVTHALRIRTPGSGRDRLEWRSMELAPGEEGTLVADLGTGAYELTCPIEDGAGEHDALGMEEGFSVTPDAPPPTARSATAPAASETGSAVDIAGFAFAPAEITVPVGSDVAWTNRDPAPHTATGDGWDTGQLAAGGSGTVRFDRAGRFAYFCAIHPGMTGTVVVQ